MASEERGGWREMEKLCEDEELMAAMGDRSIFSLDDINLDDIFLDIKDADISAFVPESPHLAPPASAGLHVSSSSAACAGEALDASAVLPEGLLCDDVDVTQLEWLSNFCEESYSTSDGLPFVVPCKAPGGLPLYAAGGTDDGGSKKASSPTAEVSESMDQELIFRSTSPISVLEQCISFSAAAGSYSSSLSSPTSSSGSGNMATATPRSPPEPVVVPARSRSKRPRPPSFSVRHPIVVPPSPPDNIPSAVAAAAPADCAALYYVGSEPDEVESDCPEENHEEEEEEKKKRKKKPKKKAAASSEGEEEEAAASSGQRKCMHCEVTKTPQWRAGPLGPKTLCNACGVRYKSGRLFPEYRPAASPTFVPTIHSNSHKKVVEIRNKVGQDAPDSDPSPRPLDVVAKSCELLEYLRRKECRAVDRPGILSG